MGLPTIAVPQYNLTIPSNGKEIKYRPFLVKEEKILLIAMESDDQKQIIEATKDIVQNCIYGADIDVNTMPAFDLEYIFLQLRGKAKGEVLELKYKCPKCEGEIPLNINVDEVKIIKTKEHTNTIKLDETLGVVMRYPDLTVQEELAEITKDKHEIDALFDTIIRCVDYIYDAAATYPAKDHTEKEMRDFIESLTDEHFQKIAKFFETMPALKHEVELICPQKVKSKNGKTNKKQDKQCGYREQLTLEGLGSFFG
jgi:hypothetical protein